MIDSDPSLLHHVFSNLLSNAVRYSPSGTTVRVRLEAGAEQVRVVVEDEGIGILPADRVRIFEPFERGSNVGNIQGTGLGLNIVKRMTTLLGGTIAVESGGTEGTRFTVVFARSPVPVPTS
jgi:signal transduction histidine kinase